MYGIRERDVPYTVLNVRLCRIAQHTHTPDETTFSPACVHYPLIPPFAVTSERFCVGCVDLVVVCTAAHAEVHMELLPCELVIARHNDCAHQDSGRLGPVQLSQATLAVSSYLCPGTMRTSPGPVVSLTARGPRCTKKASRLG